MLTETQFSTLALYEGAMVRAKHQRYFRGDVSTEQLRQIHEILKDAEPTYKQRVSFNCASCVLELLTDACNMYESFSAYKALQADLRAKQTNVSTKGTNARKSKNK